MAASRLFDRILFGPDDAPSRRRRVSSSVHALPSHMARIPSLDKALEKAPYIDVTESTCTASFDESTFPHPNPFIKLRRAVFGRPEPIWHPSFWQVRPLIGILALCMTIGCMFAAFAVLVISDGQPVSTAMVRSYSQLCVPLMAGPFHRPKIGPSSQQSISPLPLQWLTAVWRWRIWKLPRYRGGIVPHEVVLLARSNDNGRSRVVLSRQSCIAGT